MQQDVVFLPWSSLLKRLQKSLPQRDASRQSGQVGIIIILIMVVLLTIGLSVASRSTREATLSRQEAESTRVFNAAEAGVEQALGMDLNFQGDQYRPAPTSPPGTNATVQYQVDKVRNLETRLFEGVSGRVQLQDTGTTLPPSVKVEWSKEKNCNTTEASSKPASIVVSIYTINSAYNPPQTTVRHFAYAACNNNDSMTLATTSSGDLYKEVTIPLQANDNFMRIKAVYNDTFIRVTPVGGTLPVQYYDIRSSAKNQQGNENRIVEVKRTLPVAPSVLDYVLFSGTSVVK